MNKGLPIFTLSKDVISGWFPISKNGNNTIFPYIGKEEEIFLFYCEYHPLIKSIERADVDNDFLIANKLQRSLLAPVVIPYEFENKSNNYYPDFILSLEDGKTVIVEIGLYKNKMTPKSLAKALAAINYCKENNWDYWFIPYNKNLSKTKLDNLKLLKSYDKQIYIDNTLQSEIFELLNKSHNGVTIEYITKTLSTNRHKLVVEMAVYEFISRAAKQGKLNYDFEKKINRNSVIKISSDDHGIAIPPFIHMPYSHIIKEIENSNNSVMESPSVRTVTTRPHNDTEQFTKDKKEEFYLRRAAVLEAISISRKESIKEIADKYGYHRSSLRHFIERYLQYGEKSLLGYASYNSDKIQIDKDLQNSIKKLVKQNPGWKITRLHESLELKNEVIKLSKLKEQLIQKPSYISLYRYVSKLKKAEEDNFSEYPSIQDRKKGKTEKISDPGSYVRSIEHQLDQVQTDAHWLDIKIVTIDKQDIAGKLWAIVLVDVKTNNILGYSLTLKTPMEEDYMMALKCCITPKDKIVNEFDCENEWPCSGIPRVILDDNGKIFTSNRATDVVVRRLRIIEEDAPVYAPSAKGTVESIFKWVVEKLTSRLPGYTKGRNSKQLEKEVLEAGITFDDFEKLFVKAIVDSWNINWDDTRNNSRQLLWEDASRENLTVPTWISSQDELKLLLMKEERERKVDRHGISFCGRYYQNKTMIREIIGKKVNIRYDKRDISVLYVYLLDGTYYCEVYCNELLGIRRSIWEDDMIKKGQITLEKYYKNIANNNLNRNIENVNSNKRRKKLPEKVAQYKEQVRIYDNADIHTEKVKKELSNVRPVKENYSLEEINYNEVRPENLSNFILKKSTIRRI